MKPVSKGKRILWLSLFIPLSFVCGSWQVGHATCQSFSDVIFNGTYGVADSQGKVIASCNLDTPYIPASIIKISTVLAAMNILGPEYRFVTEFYQDDSNNLFIKGYGDPLLISEEVEQIVEQLQDRGVQQVSAIFIDNSAFSLSRQTPGLGFSKNPYDAPVGPVSVNFNSVPVRITKKGKIYSGEPQTPYLPLMAELARNQPPGKHRINICRNHCRPETRMARYTGELFRALLTKAGIKVGEKYGIQAVPKGARLLYAHINSNDLEDLSGAMLQFSSNYIANLVYLASGTKKFGYPATWEKAEDAVQQELALIIGAEAAAAIKQVEGSGLSRDNTITARAMLRILDSFQPYARLLGNRRGVLTKTGTMKGIYNYAGYLKDGSPYVIMLNQEANTRTTVLDRLKMKKHRR